MTTIIDNYKLVSLLVLVIPIIVSAIKNIIDELSITSIERKLSNTRKIFYVNSSMAGIYSFIASAFMIGLIYSDFENLKIKLGLEINTIDNKTLIIILFIFFFLLFFFLVYLSYLLMRIITLLFGLNYDYYLLDDKIKWTILRVNNRREIVCSNGFIRKFFEINKDNTYLAKPVLSRYKRGFYGNLKLNILNLLVVPLLYALLVEFNNPWFIILCLYALFAITVINISKFNYNKHVNNQKKFNSQY